MPYIQVANGTTLFYDTFGPEDAKPIVLIEGLTAQMIKWRGEFCGLLVDAGFRVIRFDNRDVGLSQKFDGASYALTDMAEDTAGLIQALGLGPCAVVGQSMGGMIAQELAVRHPELVASLTLFYTSASQKWLLPQALERNILQDLCTPSREEAIKEFLAGEYLCRSERYPQDLPWLTQLAAQAYDRDPVKAGNARQAAAVQSGPDRNEAVTTIQCPTLILTGDADKLIDYRASHELHELIPGAHLEVFPGMGHEIPQALWAEFVREISQNSHRSVTAGPATAKTAPQNSHQASAH
ncbi:alpha/beta fold hydrolase [Paenarthrobacter sp. 22069]|uniref:alpha/beta fold hydrolase n=1 Tax=Paenarthrobacter sp. 22069 TaxID=3453864 RepID=UPI003F858230